MTPSDLAELEIHKVITDTLLPMGTSPATESIAPINYRMNLQKYEHSYQTVVNLERIIGGGTLSLWVHRHLLWGCVYDEILDLIIVFINFRGCICTP